MPVHQGQKHSEQVPEGSVGDLGTALVGNHALLQLFPHLLPTQPQSSGPLSRLPGALSAAFSHPAATS